MRSTYCAILVSLILSLMLVPAFGGDGDQPSQDSKHPDYAKGIASVSRSAPASDTNVATSRLAEDRKLGKLSIFIAFMGVIAVTWGFVIYRYHDKFPILKHPDLTWGGHARRPW